MSPRREFALEGENFFKALLASVEDVSLRCYDSFEAEITDQRAS